MKWSEEVNEWKKVIRISLDNQIIDAKLASIASELDGAITVGLSSGVLLFIMKHRLMPGDQATKGEKIELQKDIESWLHVFRR